MVTKDQFIKGIIGFADAEIIPHLPVAGKWCVGSLICLSQGKLNKLLDSYLDNSIVKTLGIVDENGMIDEVAIIDALKESASKYGKLDIAIPILGTMSFSAVDIEKLKLHLANHTY